MKKLLFLAALLFGFAACKDKDEAATPNDKPQKTELEQTAYQMEIILNSYSDYGPSQVGEILSDKEWEMWSYLEYDSSWRNLLKDYYAFGKMNTDGLSPDIYQFRDNGTVVHQQTKQLENGLEWVTDEGEWSFDAATKRLTLLGNTYYLEAAGPEVMVLQQEVEYVGEEPSYIRSVYIVQ